MTPRLENPEEDRPNDLRSNIINLANFIFKREIEIMSQPEKSKLDILISINRDIAAGLMAREQAKNVSKNQKTDTDSESQEKSSSLPINRHKKGIFKRCLITK